MRSFVISMVLVALAGTAGARKPKAEAPKADAQLVDAKRHFDQAVALFNDGDFGGALAEFEASYKIRPSAGVLYNIGLTQKSLLCGRDFGAQCCHQRQPGNAQQVCPHRPDARLIDERLAHVQKHRAIPTLHTVSVGAPPLRTRGNPRTSIRAQPGAGGIRYT